MNFLQREFRFDLGAAPLTTGLAAPCAWGTPGAWALAVLRQSLAAGSANTSDALRVLTPALVPVNWDRLKVALVLVLDR